MVHDLLPNFFLTTAGVSRFLKFCALRCLFCILAFILMQKYIFIRVRLKAFLIISLNLSYFRFSVKVVLIPRAYLLELIPLNYYSHWELSYPNVLCFCLNAFLFIILCGMSLFVQCIMILRSSFILCSLFFYKKTWQLDSFFVAHYWGEEFICIYIIVQPVCLFVFFSLLFLFFQL